MGPGGGSCKKLLVCVIVALCLLGAFSWHFVRAPSSADQQLCRCNTTVTSAAPTLQSQDVHSKTADMTNGTASSKPIIFFITPTYTRPTQKADLTRLSQTLRLVDALHWILIEDHAEATPLVTELLEHCRVKNTHLYHRTPRKGGKNSRKNKNRGAEQRNAGLNWLRANYRQGEVEGVVYFGDDDNTYDLRLFDEMRYTKKVSVWPVGLAGGLLAEGPICKDGKVINFHVGWAPNRKFPMDMAAFAFNVNLVLADPKVEINPKGRAGYMETDFLSKITTVKELEAKANDCTSVYVWHTQTKDAYLVYEKKHPTTLIV